MLVGQEIGAPAGVAAPWPGAIDLPALHRPRRDPGRRGVESFQDLAAAMRAASDSRAPAADRVRALCRAHLGYAAQSPGRYRALFERTEPNIAADSRTYPRGLAAFGLLSSALGDAVDQGTSASTDRHGDSAALWTALHGLATLPAATPGFPWPPTSTLLDRLTIGLAHLTTATGSARRR